jgi:hypothetical protein
MPSIFKASSPAKNLPFCLRSFEYLTLHIMCTNNYTKRINIKSVKKITLKDLNHEVKNGKSLCL